jgi:steroid 5-alpha reductase family enzyme/NAD(P)-dependent dehydrogenase (short-subunit alcohol dehydrogenase family)
MSDTPLAGRVAVVSGGGRGLGRSFCLALARQGAKVVVNNRNRVTDADGRGPADHVAGQITAAGGEAVAEHSDAADPAGGEAIVAAAVERWGRLDICVANAAIGPGGMFHKQPAAQFGEVVEINLQGSVRLARAAMAVMRPAGYGRIILVGSTGGLHGDVGLSAYATSKGALLAFGRSLAAEGAGKGVLTNMLLPYALTQMTDDGMPASARPRLDPDLVAPVLTALASPECRLNGEYLVTGGGQAAPGIGSGVGHRPAAERAGSQPRSAARPAGRERPRPAARISGGRGRVQRPDVGRRVVSWGPLLVNLAVTAGLVAVLMLATFGYAMRTRVHAIMDTIWPLGFVLIALASFGLSAGSGVAGRRVLVLVLTAVWGLRLGAHIYSRNRGQGEDKRYASLLRRNRGSLAAFVLRYIYWMQGRVMWFVSLPVQAAMYEHAPLGPVSWLGAAVWAVGFGFEAVGDAQLRRFRADPANAGKVLDRGLWRYTRHPNYFGDAVVWFGLWLLACSHWLGLVLVASPVYMTNMLVRHTGKRLLEKHMARSKGAAYAGYVRRTNGFIPWPPR